MKNIRNAVLATAVSGVMGNAVCMAGDSPGCLEDSGMNSGTYTMEFDGLTRTYRVHVPKDHETGLAAPLLVMFHGWGGDENDYLDVALVRDEADKRAYILVAPRGVGSGQPDESNNSWSFRGSTTGLDGNGDTICDDALTPEYAYPSCIKAGIAQNGCAWTHCQGSPEGDVDFTLALIEKISEKLCVDTGRVYATGSSNGGMFTWELAQNSRSAGRFRAIAPNIGLPHRGYLDVPPGGLKIPALLTTGTEDRTVPPGNWEETAFTTTLDGDHFYYASATAITRAWSNAMGCRTDRPAATVDTGLNEADCRSYCTDDAGLTRVLDCRVAMGHVSGLSWSWSLTLDFFDQHDGNQVRQAPASK